jgi:hypothetical protein
MISLAISNYVIECKVNLKEGVLEIKFRMRQTFCREKSQGGTIIKK